MTPTLQWGIVVAGGLLVLTLTAIVATRNQWQGPARGAVVGVVCGLVAAIVIIQPVLDVVPDAIEPLVVALVIVLVSVGLMMVTWRRRLRE